MMKKLRPITCRVDELISVDKFTVDEENAHIELACESLSELDSVEFGKLVRVCPAGLYREDENGERTFDYAGCLLRRFLPLRLIYLIAIGSLGGEWKCRNARRLLEMV